MPVNVSIKAVPNDVLTRIKKRAERNHRSLQGELIVILKDAVGMGSDLTPDEALAKLSKDAWHTQSDSGRYVRKDRDAG